MNLEQDFIKYEAIGATAFYGYANELDIDVDNNKWAIRAVVGTGSTFDVYWSNKKKEEYISKWSDKEYYFQSPSLSDPNWIDSITWSCAKINNYANLSFECDRISGVDLYNIRIENQNGDVVGPKNILKNNIYNYAYTDQLSVNNSDTTISYSFLYGSLGATYSFYIEAKNGYGITSSQFYFYQE